MTQPCDQCAAYEHKQRTGSWPDGASFHRWAMWGCTCTPEQEQAALDYINLITR